MMKTLHTQRGGTILGFIAGVITGLVIAVIVAMVVTKTAIPFSQKHAKQGKIAEPAVASATAAADPNKPMYASTPGGKDAVKASAKSAVEATRSMDDAAKKVAPVDADNDPIAEKIRQKTEATTLSQKRDASGEDKWTYLLQTNAYREPAEAQNERARLALSGFEAKISETTIGGAKLYRVRLGPFANIDAMNQTRTKLSDNGINAAVVRIPK